MEKSTENTKQNSVKACDLKHVIFGSDDHNWNQHWIQQFTILHTTKTFSRTKTSSKDQTNNDVSQKAEIKVSDNQGQTGSSNRPWLSRQTSPISSGVTRNS